MKFGLTRVSFCVLLIASSTCSLGQTRSQTCHTSETARGLRVTSGDGVMDLEILGPNVLRIDIQPHGRTSPRTLVMDPNLKASKLAQVSIRRNGESAEIASSEIRASITCQSPITLSVSDAALQKLVEQADPFGQAAGHRINLQHAPSENLYGMSGLSMYGLSKKDGGGGLTRNNGATISAGAEGEAGAPWFFTARYGVLIDSDGGAFDTKADEVRFSGDSRDDTEYFVMTGAPLQVISTLSILTGRPPLPPKWSLGFLNSQWGSTEAELKQIADTYRAKHIPVDAFILDFDWKAWGEDHYGEWRWNSTSAPGNFNPNQFPDGASGLFSKQMAAEGIHIAGILKPRILLYKPGSTTEMLEPAAYAQAHDLWLPNQKESVDYFSGRPARDLDFSKPETRSWYWQHLEPTFDSGMAGWWNDEADNANNFQFLNMGRALYDGQRDHSNIRVWSLNRNYYLGSQRYGYAAWSGDIPTGFGSMAYQRMRMLATIDTGEPHWSMDTGGFSGQPTSENYARWMEFAAFVPIDRVHGDIGQKRQPWRYGSIAEVAATKALRLRYSLLPYIYSYERMATETGVSVVRPLFWLFPGDAKLANQGSSWMFGDALLVSPVVTPGETEHSIYLPAGIWYDYFHGTKFEGGKTIHYAIDAHTWQDIPLFVRAGSILASESPQAYAGQQPVHEIVLDVFATAQPARFVYYDDDGATYTYEQGVYYRQTIQASASGQTTRVSFEKPSGSFHSPLRSYLIHIHGNRRAKSVLLNGKPLSRVTANRLDAAVGGTLWATSEDKFGPVTTIRIPARQASNIELR